VCIHRNVFNLLNNPNIDSIMRSSSYTLDEVHAALAIAKSQYSEYQRLLNESNAILKYEDGKPMNFIYGYGSEYHRSLQSVLSSVDFPCIETGRLVEPFPVKKWNASLAKQRTAIYKIKKAIKGD